MSYRSGRTIKKRASVLGPGFDGNGLALWLDATSPNVSGSNWPDLSGNGNDAGQGTANRQPSIDSSTTAMWLDFDGSDDALDAGGDASLQPGTGDFTLAMWIRSSDWASNQDRRPVAQSRGSNPWEIIRDTNNVLRLRGPWDHTSSNNLVADDEWIHVAYTADRDGNGTWYRNGSSHGTQDISAASATDISPDNFVLGAYRAPSYDKFFSGSIAALQWWTRLLASDEIRLIYERSKWRFE